MGKVWQNVANLLEYLGLRSPSYFHTVPDYNYVPDDILAYYLDMTPRADYPGPFDADGLPLLLSGGKTVMFPTHLIMHALGHLERHRRQPSEEHLDIIRKAADWLVNAQQEDGSWTVDIPNRSFNLAPPFRSAMVQGLAMSLLTRATILLGRDEYAVVAERGLAPFQRTTREGGVATEGEGTTFYEEYPCQPPCHVLNGFFYAMFGLHDLVRFKNDDTAQELFQAGVATVIKWLPKYDMGYWSLYHIPADRPNPATVAYHRLHINQLAVMYAITEEPVFDTYRRRWDGYLRNRINALRTLPAKFRWLSRK
jgi:hypothetical protein